MAELQAQLDQVTSALLGKPNDPLLLKLKADIEEGLELMTELAAVSGATAAAPSHTDRWRDGDQVQAKFSADGMMYQATVESGSDEGGYVVVFKGYNNNETVPADEIFPLKGSGARGVGAQTITSSARQDATEILSTDTPEQRAAKKKKAKGQRTFQRRKEQDEKLNAGKQSWQAFNAKSKTSSGKKKLGGVTRKSIFATPDTLDGKVGVVGSGAGMTDFGARKKHRHEFT